MSSSAMALRPAILRQSVFGAARVQCRYMSMPSRERMLREMRRAATKDSKKTDVESMSAIQKKANDEYFKSGGGPLFPGECKMDRLTSWFIHTPIDAASHGCDMEKKN